MIYDGPMGIFEGMYDQDAPSDIGSQTFDDTFEIGSTSNSNPLEDGFNVPAPEDYPSYRG